MQVVENSKIMRKYTILHCLAILVFSSKGSAVPLDTDVSWGKPSYYVDPDTKEWVPTQGGFFWPSVTQEGNSFSDYNWATYPTRIIGLSNGDYVVSGQAKGFNSVTNQFIEKFDSQGNSLSFHNLLNPTIFPNAGVLADQEYGGRIPPAAGPVETNQGSILWAATSSGSYPPSTAKLYNCSLDLSKVLNSFEYSHKRAGGSYLKPYSVGNGAYDGKFLDLGKNDEINIYVQTEPKGIARLTLNGNLDSRFSGDGFLSVPSLDGQVFGKILSDGSLVVAGSNRILRIKEDGSLMGGAGDGVYFSVSDSPLSSLGEVVLYDVIELGGGVLRFVGSHNRYFASGSRQQVVTFDLTEKGVISESNYLAQVHLLSINEGVSQAKFDAIGNIILGFNKKIIFVDCLGASSYQNSINDGAYRKTASYFSNTSFPVYDMAFEAGRILVLNGPMIQALKYPKDSDRDGLWDSSERSIGTDPNKRDSDGDGLSDWEDRVKWKLDPLDGDSDNDGILDGREVVAPDADRDGLIDEVETNTGAFISNQNTGTDPNKADSDGDGLNDSMEVADFGTDPNNKDSDADGFDDLFEINTGFNPNQAGSTPDAQSGIQTAVKFWFNAGNGLRYRIESSTDLQIWSTVETDIVGSGGMVIRFYDIENQPKRYFRVVKISGS